MVHQPPPPGMQELLLAVSVSVLHGLILLLRLLRISCAASAAWCALQPTLHPLHAFVSVTFACLPRCLPVVAREHDDAAAYRGEGPLAPDDVLHPPPIALPSSPRRGSCRRRTSASPCRPASRNGCEAARPSASVAAAAPAAWSDRGSAAKAQRSGSAERCFRRCGGAWEVWRCGHLRALKELVEPPLAHPLAASARPRRPDRAHR